jgi:HlyD family secretion protein
MPAMPGGMMMGVKPSESEKAAASERPSVEAPPLANLPVAVPAKLPALRRRRWPLVLVLALALLGGAGGGAYWWLHLPPGLPPGFALGNGRLEADEIDIATKIPGRVAEILADEGDKVASGQVVARMDTRDLEASLNQAKAQALQAQQALDEARANLQQQTTLVTLAKQQLERTRFLLPKGFATKEEFDQRQQQLDAAQAGLNAATARVAQAEHGIEAARQAVDRIAIDIKDNTLIAPRAGRIEYRLANTGEVLGAGGKVFTMLDTGYLYMDVFLPTAEAGRVAPGAEARIVLDAMPATPLPAKVTFVAPQAQFTPKAVETKSERDKLMFRVRVRLDLAQAGARATDLQAGSPGMAYIRLDRSAAWPATLSASSNG